MPPSPPNVLVIMADQMKATASHLYGNPFCITPGLERLANDGVLFETAITPHPLCVPARVSLWSSQWSRTHGVRGNQGHMPSGVHHAFRTWREAGFHTALIGKDHCFASDEDRNLFDVRCTLGHEGRDPHDPPRGIAWSRPNAAIDAAHEPRKAMPQQAAAVSYAVTDGDPAASSTGLVTDTTITWLERAAQRDTPFAAWVSYPDPHTPYEVNRRWADTIDPTKVPLDPPLEAHDVTLPERTRILIDLLGMHDATETDARGVVATYHAMVTFIDHGVARLLDALERLGLREDTIVVFCSDHGDFAGEYGMTRKGGAFYDAMVRVPLIVSWPGRVPQAQRESSPVNLIDLVPTLLTLQDIDVPASMQGHPLPTVTTNPARHETFSEYGAGTRLMTRADLTVLATPRGLSAAKASLAWREAEGRRRMIRTRTHKYVTDPMGDLDELYDLQTDPQERTNIAGRAHHVDVQQSLEQALSEWDVTTQSSAWLTPSAPRLTTPPPKGRSA